ncbi:MAG: hypothetical protein Q9191_000150 [Dirinaria sp. TL-2023a]
MASGYHRLSINDESFPESPFIPNSSIKSLSPKSTRSGKSSHGDSSHAASVRRKHRLISIAAGTVMCLFGYEQGVFGGIIVGHEFQQYFHDPSPSMIGLVTSVYDLGCFAGAILALFVGEWLGRKRMLIVFTIIMTSGILVQTAAHSVTHLIWGRIIAGIGNGGNTSTAPVWHVETSVQNAKGKAVVKEMVVNVVGFILANIFTLLFSGLNTEAQWRFPLGIQLIFIVIILTMVPLLPESPRWLLSRGRDAEAKDILASLNEQDSEEEFLAIRQSVRIEQATEASWAQIFKGGQASRRLLLGMLLQVCQQLTGINVLCYFLPLVLHKSVGLSEFASRVLATATALFYLSAAAVSLRVIEAFRRRTLLMSMAAMQALAFLGVAISTEVGHDLTSGIIATVCISGYFIAFGFAWIAIPWLYPAEINSLSMRTKGAALATACDWLFNYAVVQTTPIGMHHLHWGIYLIYATLNAAFVPVVYYLVVETSGRSLEQIDRWFELNPGWLVHKADHSPVFEKMTVRGQSSESESAVEESEGMVQEFERENERSGATRHRMSF